MFVISVRERGKEEHKFTFRKRAITVGRLRINDIILPKRNISKKHSKIELSSENQVIVYDLGSTNGTFVNGTRATTGLVVTEADKIFVGDYILQVKVVEDKSAIDLKQDLRETAVPPPLPGEESDQRKTMVSMDTRLIREELRKMGFPTPDEPADGGATATVMVSVPGDGPPPLDLDDEEGTPSAGASGEVVRHGSDGAPAFSSDEIPAVPSMPSMAEISSEIEMPDEVDPEEASVEELLDIPVEEEALPEVTAPQTFTAPAAPIQVQPPVAAPTVPSRVADVRPAPAARPGEAHSEPQRAAPMAIFRTSAPLSAPPPIAGPGPDSMAVSGASKTASGAPVLVGPPEARPESVARPAQDDRPVVAGKARTLCEVYFRIKADFFNSVKSSKGIPDRVAGQSILESLLEQHVDNLVEADRKKIAIKLFEEFVGFGPAWELYKEARIVEVFVGNQGTIKAYGRLGDALPFSSTLSCPQAVKQLAFAILGRVVSETTAAQVSIPDGTAFVLVDTAASTATVRLVKSGIAPSLQALQDTGVLTEMQGTELKRLYDSGTSLLVLDSTGASGPLLQALSGLVPSARRSLFAGEYWNPSSEDARVVVDVGTLGNTELPRFLRGLRLETVVAQWLPGCLLSNVVHACASVGLPFIASVNCPGGDVAKNLSNLLRLGGDQPWSKIEAALALQPLVALQVERSGGMAKVVAIQRVLLDPVSRAISLGPLN